MAQIIRTTFYAILATAIVTALVLAVLTNPKSVAINIVYGVIGLSIGVLWSEYSYTNGKRDRDR